VVQRGTVGWIQGVTAGHSFVEAEQDAHEAIDSRDTVGYMVPLHCAGGTAIGTGKPYCAGGYSRYREALLRRRVQHGAGLRSTVQRLGELCQELPEHERLAHAPHLVQQEPVP